MAIYTRVSTDTEDQLNSLKNQQVYYSNFCRENNLDLINMYADEGLSGTNMKREDFLRMLHDAGLNIIKDEISTRFIKSNRKPKFEYIITKDVSRFARNTNVMEVVKLLREKNVYIRFQNANIDTKDENYQFLLNLFLNFAQQESIDRSQKVKFGLVQRARDGKYHFGSERLYGYGYDKEKQEIYLIENEAAIVKKVFDLYTIEKLGSRVISDTLNQDGHKTQNGKIWTANSIIRMLSNEKYTGNVNLLKYSYGDVTKENREKKVKDQEEWVYQENLIPSIITTETFQLAQNIMKSRTSENRGTNTPKNIFSKKIKCARCGKNYIRTSQTQRGNTYYFYACATRRRTKQCDNHSISLMKLEKVIQPYCEGKLHQDIDERKASLINFLNISINMLEGNLKRSEKLKDNLRKQIEEKEDEINKLFDSFLSSNEMVKKAVERKIQTLETERSKLESDLLNYDEAKITSELFRLNETKKHIQKSSKKKTFTIEEVLSFIHEIRIDGDDVEVELTFDNLLPKTLTTKDVLIDVLDKYKLKLNEFKGILDRM